MGKMSVRANEENVHTVTVNNTRCINGVPRVNNSMAMLCFTLHVRDNLKTINMHF